MSVNASNRPRILATTGALALSPLEWSFEVFAEAGFDGVELLASHNPVTRDAAGVRRALARTGLAAPSVHGPYMLALKTVMGIGYPAKTKRALDLAAEVGAELMVAHAPFSFERAGRRWVADHADAEADARGVRFGMENLYPIAGWAVSTAITPADLSAHRDVVFDTSHFAVSGIDLFDAWEAVGPRVRHLHISDNRGDGSDSHAPIGEGVLPLASFLARVGRDGFAGTITLELSPHGHLQSREALVAFLGEQRRRAAAAVAGELAPSPESSSAAPDATSSYLPSPA